MINDILDISKIEVSDIAPEFSNLRIGELVENSTIVIRESCVKNRIDLACQIEKNLVDATIQANERGFKQLMFNLLSNAGKFTSAGGKITVSAKKKDDHVKICVSDTGIGIAPEDLARIFEPFLQISGGIQDKTPGTGLGLNLCKKIVEQHGGRIWVESKGVNKGSQFYVELPLSHEEESSICKQQESEFL